MLDGAVKRHFDPVALLVGDKRYLWVLRKMLFHDLMRSRDPLSPRMTKRERHAIGARLAARVAAEQAGTHTSAAAVLAHCKLVLASEGRLHRVREAVESARREVCTELLESSGGRAYFLQALARPVSPKPLAS